MEDVQFDDSQFYVFSKDMMRVDIGLMIQRPPIFMRMRDNDMQFLKDRSQIFEEWHTDTK